MPTTNEFNVTIELDTDRPADAFEDDVPDEYSAVLHQSAYGRVAVTLTTTADTVASATALGLTLVQTWLDVPPYSVEALPTAEYDRRVSLMDSPAMLSVPQAADALDVSEQRVRQLLTGGQLTGHKVGREWLVTLASVQARQQSRPRG